MSCNICGRGVCTESAHSIDDQTSYDLIEERIKEDILNSLKENLKRLESYSFDGVEGEFLSYDDVEKMIFEFS